MAKSEVRTGSAPGPSGAYSQGIVANGFLYTAGMGPHDPATGQVVGTDVAEQTARTLANLQAVLAVRGLDLSDVVKVTVHLADLRGDFAEFDRAYRERMPEPRPVRTTVGSALYDILVEIDVVAALRG